MKKNILNIILIILISIFIYNHYAFAGGLSTTFGKVLVEDLPVGKAYSMEQESKTPLIITNTSSQKVKLVIKLLYPHESELEEGFEPVPDIEWIELSQTEFTIEPGESAKTDVIIHIPDEEQYRGKKYQMYIWSHTTGTSIGVGLKSKLLFTVREEVAEETIDEES